MDGPPQFGERFSGDGWHRTLDQIAAEPGFAKPLCEDAALDRLLVELEAGKNPWAAALERAGMLELPYVSAVLPDSRLLEQQRKQKQDHLRATATRLASAYGLPEMQAIDRYRAEMASATVELETLEHGSPQPNFLREPPLELDHIDWSEGHLPSGPRLVRTQFQTPFTNISIAFDLRGVPDRDWELLSFLGDAIGSVGGITRMGERLDYAKTQERLMGEIYGAGVNVGASPRSDRAEIIFSGYAASPEEVDKSVEWIETYLLRPNLSYDSRERLVDVLRGDIQSLRGIFQQDEESWVSGVVAAYKYQDRPLYLHVSSPFTTLRDLNRLRWRLEDPAPIELAVMRATATAVIAAAKNSDKASVGKLLDQVDGDLGEYLRWEFSHLPDESWRSDLQKITSDFLGDVGRSSETIHRVQVLASKVLVRSRARVHINGNAKNIERATRQINALLTRLPQGKPVTVTPKRRDIVMNRLRERFPGLNRPVHVALVNNNGKTGTISVWAPAASYHSRKRADLV